MKKISTILFVFLFSNLIFGQVSGNVNYRNNIRYDDNNIDVNFSSNSTIISVKGMANVKANTYVAIFSVTQVGKTAREVNELIDARINRALDKIKIKPSVKTYIDMISFVPIYEYNVEKKLFRKKTYNEIPAGFELKKNIHIEYTDPSILNEIITSLSEVDIYDLVRVDYFSKTLESVKKELRKKAKVMLQEKVRNYESITSQKIDSLNKNMVDGFKIVLPVEMYESYQAYNRSSLNLKKSANVKSADKSKTLYYQPIIDKEFDFVVNPSILEPVIQVMYEIKLKIEYNKASKNNKEYILITPNGDMRRLNYK